MLIPYIQKINPAITGTRVATVKIIPKTVSIISSLSISLHFESCTKTEINFFPADLLRNQGTGIDPVFFGTRKE